MYCQQCGHQIASNAKFCSICGKETAPGGVTTTAVAGLASVPIATAAPSVPAPSPVTTSTIHTANVNRHRTAGIILIALLAVISGAIFIPAGCMFLAGGYYLELATAIPVVHLAGMVEPVVHTTAESWIRDAQLEGLGAVLLGIGYLVMAVGLLRLKEGSGRIFGMVFSGIIVLNSARLISTGEGSVVWHVISIGFNAWVVYYLYTPRIKARFAASSLEKATAAG